MGVVDDVLKFVASVAPEERFAPFKVEAAAALSTEGFHRGQHFPKAQVILAAGGQPAMLAMQVAAVREHQSPDERHGPSAQMVGNDLLHAE